MPSPYRLLRSLAAVVSLLVVLVGCGAAAADGDEGTARIWVTRDRGADVLHDEEVPAGLTVLQALDRVADVESRYGGRFVHAIDGIEGSLSRGWDWFYFVNGVAAERGAAEYRLRDGDIAWWDYRRWEGSAEVRVVVGAFPEPFLRGYDGERRPVVVTHERPEQRRAALAIAKLLGGRVVDGRVRCCPNRFHLASGRPCFSAEADSPRGPYRFVFAGDAIGLARDPARVRFRFGGPPCG